jgi:hypothetical protein
LVETKPIKMSGDSATTAHAEDGGYATSPYRPHHAGKLTSAGQFQSWELRTSRSYISSFDGYGRQLLDRSVDVDEARQEHIFHFLIQIVHEQEGFAKLRAIEGSILVGTGTPARRGYQAWECLRNHYLQVGSVRLMTLQNEFKKPQQPHETGSMFVTRLINTRLGIIECGEMVSDNMLKNYILVGLRDEYQPYISSIYDRVMERSIDDIQLSVIQACNRVETKMNERAETLATSSHFSSMKDGFGYQQPPRSRKVPSPATTEITLLEKFQAFLSSESSKGFQPSRRDSTSYVNPMTRQQPRHGGNPRIICHRCGQPGHVKSHCPSNKGASSSFDRSQGRFGERRDAGLNDRTYVQQGTHYSPDGRPRDTTIGSHSNHGHSLPPQLPFRSPFEEPT